MPTTGGAKERQMQQNNKYNSPTSRTECRKLRGYSGWVGEMTYPTSASIESKRACKAVMWSLEPCLWRREKEKKC